MPFVLEVNFSNGFPSECQLQGAYHLVQNAMVGGFPYLPQAPNTHILQLDDPDAVDHSDGTRTTHVQPFDTRYLSLINSDGSVTFGVDGACLEWQTVIPPGGWVWCRYAFLNFDSQQSNDFAVMELVESRRNPVPISSARMLGTATSHSGGWHTLEGLRNTGPTPFVGTVRWVVSNGRTRRMTQSQGGAWPSALLLDAIGIVVP